MLFVFIVVMMDMAAVVLMLFVFIVVMMAMAAVVLMLFVFIVVMMMVLMLHLCQLRRHRRHTFHRLHQLSAGQFGPGRRHQRGMVVMLPDQGNGSIQLSLRDRIGAGQDNGGGGLDLVVVELAKVLHIDLDLTGIRHRNSIAQNHIFICDFFYSSNHIRQLAHTGGFDHDPVRIILTDNLFQRLTEIAHQTAADAAGIHFCNVDARILQKAAVNTDLTELILNEHQLFTLIGLLDHFLNQRRFPRAEKPGVNIDFCHAKHLLYKFILYIITPTYRKDKTKIHEDSTVSP